MLLNFCLGCKKKKLSSSFSDDKLDKESLENSKSSKQTDSEVDANHLNVSNALASSAKATSPISICKFNNCNKLTNDQNPTPVHNLNSDGSVRIKSTAINRALPDLPTNDLANTSLNSNGSAINRSIDRPQLDRSTPSANNFNIANLSLNQTTHPNSLIINQLSESKFNCISTTSTSTFNPPHSTHSTASNLLPLQNNLSESQSQCLNELRDDDLANKYNKNEHHKHHSYARIKDNNVVDSSTENDTDDYYDSTIVAKRGLDAQKVTINVPSANTNQTSLNSSLNEATTSLYAVSGNFNSLANRIQSNLEMPYHISNISTINNPISNPSDSNFGNLSSYPTTGVFASSANNFDLSADEEPNKEVSYNKISVREPLSKVLAERAALMEHHYTEVYDENNSFYEEIAGSTNSSVTYTKIGDIQITPSTSAQNQSNLTSRPVSSSIQLTSTSPISIPIETSVLTIRNNSSRSTSPMQTVPVLQTFLPNSNILSTNLNNNNSNLLSNNLPSTSQQQPFNCEALYSQVNKLTKKNEKFALQPNTNDLYAKVQKNLKQSNDQTDNRKIHSSTPDMNNLTSSFKGNMNKDKQPPPLPKNHPTKSTNLFAIKSNTNLNNHETTYSQPYAYQLNVFPQHKRSFSSSSQYQDNDSDYYETFPLSNKSDDENHGYEVVKKKKSNDKLKIDDQFDNEIVDAGYEIINYAKTSKEKGDYGSDDDSPCYEVIKNVSSSNKDQEDECVEEPDYEVIKSDKVPSFNNLKSQDSGSKLRRKESDVSTSDPGYERIMHIRSQPQTYYNLTNNGSKINESNEDYEVVGNNMMDRL